MNTVEAVNHCYTRYDEDDGRAPATAWWNT